MRRSETIVRLRRAIDRQSLLRGPGRGSEGHGAGSQATKADINGPQGDAAATTVEKGDNELGVHQRKRKDTVTPDAETIFRNADKELKDLRRQEQEARHDRAARVQRIKDIRENMRQVQDEARKAYRKLKERELAL